MAQRFRVLDRSLDARQRLIRIILTSGAAVATFFFETRFRAGYDAFLYLDALAMAVFTVIATERTRNLGFEPGIAILMGVITGIGGGILRDLLTGPPTLLMRGSCP